MEQLSSDLRKILLESGADLAGFADLSRIENIPYHTGVIIAIHQSVTGTLWKAGMELQDILDVDACREAREKEWRNWDKPYELSENCIAACPYTK